jgi:hypothetical protein
MAHNNYSQQPYYGLPFQIPPQQMQQPVPNAPQDAHGSSQALQHAPAPNAFYIPGLQQAPPSHVNPHAYSQNAQQPPYPSGTSTSLLNPRSYNMTDFSQLRGHRLILLLSLL